MMRPSTIVGVMSGLLLGGVVGGLLGVQFSGEFWTTNATTQKLAAAERAREVHVLLTQGKDYAAKRALVDQMRDAVELVAKLEAGKGRRYLREGDQATNARLKAYLREASAE